MICLGSTENRRISPCRSVLPWQFLRGSIQDYSYTADKDFNFDEFLSEPKKAKKSKPKTTRNTSTTRTTDNTSQTNTETPLHPFSVRLDKPYIDKIKAVAWWKRISQRELIEQAVDKLLSDMEQDQLEQAMSSFQDQSS